MRLYISMVYSSQTSCPFKFGLHWNLVCYYRILPFEVVPRENSSILGVQVDNEELKKPRFNFLLFGGLATISGQVHRLSDMLSSDKTSLEHYFHYLSICFTNKFLKMEKLGNFCLKCGVVSVTVSTKANVGPLSMREPH